MANKQTLTIYTTQPHQQYHNSNPQHQAPSLSHPVLARKEGQHPSLILQLLRLDGKNAIKNSNGKKDNKDVTFTSLIFIALATLDIPPHTLP